MKYVWVIYMYCMWMIYVVSDWWKLAWTLCHTFGVMYEILCFGTLSMKSLRAEIIWLHWSSKSHRLRYQWLRSWRKSSYTQWLLVVTWYWCLDLPRSDWSGLDVRDILNESSKREYTSAKKMKNGGYFSLKTTSFSPLFFSV